MLFCENCFYILICGQIFWRLMIFAPFPSELLYTQTLFKYPSILKKVLKDALKPSLGLALWNVIMTSTDVNFFPLNWLVWVVVAVFFFAFFFIINVCATPPTVLCWFLKLYRCFCHGLKICMWFGYSPQIIFCHFFPQVELSHFFGIFTIKVNR